MPTIDRSLKRLTDPGADSAPATPSLSTFWDSLANTLEKAVKERTRPPDNWEDWVRAIFPRAVIHDFADHHRESWEWVAAIPPSAMSAQAVREREEGEEGEEAEEEGGQGRRIPIRYHRPPPFVAIWARGAGKTTTEQIQVIYVAARETRRYAVIVSATQDQANDKVDDIAAKFESEKLAKAYPSLSERMLSKYGAPKAWRRNRLRTQSGFIVDALGLDTAARGLKVEDYRPDFIILDDLDQVNDTEEATKKKIQTLTKTILPIGTMDVAIMCVQNLIIPHGIFGRMVNEEADYLQNRIMSGPVPAIEGLELEEVEVKGRKAGATKTVIVGGEPTWVGQDLEACQALMDDIGPSAFLEECQHHVDDNPDALWTPGMLERRGFRVAPADVPELVYVATGIDPQGTKKSKNETGIVTVGVDKEGYVYVLEDASINGTPGEWGAAAVESWTSNEGDWVVGEANFGGEMVEHTVRTVLPTIPFKLVRASRGKQQRAEPVVALYEKGVVRHVGRHLKLEREMLSWSRSCNWSPNRIDALVWAVYALVPELGGKKQWRMEHGWKLM